MYTKIFIRKIQGVLKRIIGVSWVESSIQMLEKKEKELSEATNSLFYFLDNYVDITKLGPTKDTDLRVMQKGDALMLHILDRICQKYDIKYWLDFGTLLGAVRHRGFIPWDDDLDIAVCREECINLYNALHKELDKYGFEVIWDRGRICYSYKHNQTGLFCDIFIYNKICSDLEYVSLYDLINEKNFEYIEKYERLSELQKNDKQSIAQIKDEIFHGIGDKGSQCYYVFDAEFRDQNTYLVSEKIIFPLKKIEFEGYLFPCPNDEDAYLHLLYNDYLRFPRNGILHHDQGRGALSTWARRNNVNMDGIICELEQIAESV